MKTTQEKQIDNAAQDILNLLGEALIESGVLSLPKPIAEKFTKKALAQIILDRLKG